MKQKLLFWLVCFVPLITSAQSISGFEYFFDTDPGYGKGVAINITAATDGTHEITIDVAALSNGLHALGIRAKDENGIWGMSTWQYFHKMTIAHGTPTNIVAAEYSFDTDLGYGKGKALTLTAGNDTELTTTIDVTELSDGFHLMFYRTKDENQTWGPTLFTSFIKQKIYSENDLKIVGAEYFINEEPGFGKGIPIAVIEGLDVTITQNIDITGLPNGSNFIYSRVKYSDGTWGHTERSGFYVTNGIPASANLISGEYFIDTDPGFGLATAFTYTSAADANININVPTTGLAAGFHILYTRVQDADGKWSTPEAKRFYIQPAAVIVQAKPELVKGEYFIGTDPGIGKATAFTFTKGNDIDFSNTHNTTGMAVGDYTLSYRVVDAAGNWSVSSGFPFSIKDCAFPAAPTAATGDLSVCAGETSKLYATTTTANATSYEWKIEPATAGTISGTTASSSVNWAAGYYGTANLLVRGKNTCAPGNWSPVATVAIKGIPTKITDISGNQTVCANVGSLNYSFTAKQYAESYQWVLSDANAAVLTQTGTQATLAFKNTYTGGGFNITAIAVNECGSSPASNAFEIKVNGLAKVTAISGTQEFCINPADALYSTTGTLATAYAWSVVPANAASFASTANSVSLNWDNAFSGSATLSVTASNACGAGLNTENYVVNITQATGKPNMPMGNTAVCNNAGNGTITVSPVTFATGYTWSVTPANALTYTANSTTLTADWNNAYTGNASIKVLASNICGNGTESDALVIMVNPIPIAQTLSGPAEVCTNQSGVVYTVNPIVGNTYAWQIEAGNLLSGSTTASPTVKWNSGTGKLTLTETITATGCKLESVFPVMLKAVEAPVLAEIKLKGGYILIYKGMELDGYQWYYNGIKVEGAVKQYYVAPTGSRTGNYAIEVKKGQCFTRSSDFKIGTLKTDETDFDASVQLYPNPTQTNANIEMLNDYTGNIQLTLVNQLGRIVHTATLQKENGYLLYELPMANLPTGFYQIEITAVGELPVVRKIIVQ